MSVPNHIAIILDGNGRWAKSKGMPRNYGHVQGSKNVETVCAAAYDLGVKYLTALQPVVRVPPRFDVMMHPVK